MTKKRDTVGKLSSDLLAKTADSKDPIEIERALHADYEKNVMECINSSRHSYAGDFYVVVITKKEPLMQNVLRHYFLARSTCPTPDYDQTVYRFNKQQEGIDFIWSIPSRDTCYLLLDNVTVVDPSEFGLLEFVLKFADGSLYKLAKELNGEKIDSSILIE